MTNGSSSRALVLRQQKNELQRLVTSCTGLTPFKVTSRLDAIAAQLSEDDFRRVLREEVNPADRAALLAGRLNLESISMLAAEPSDVVAAICEMANQDVKEAQSALERIRRLSTELGADAARVLETHRMPSSIDLLFVVLSCAEYLRGRSDWETLRDTDMALDLSFGDWIVLALWQSAGRPPIPSHNVEMDGFGTHYRDDDAFGHDDDDYDDDLDGPHYWEVTADVFVQVGLDMTDALDRLRELIADEHVPKFSAQDFVEARARFAQRHEVVASEAAREARDKADGVAEDIPL